MLILTRRISETLVIGDNEINISVLGIKGNQVRLGIDAPDSIPVHRQEIYLKIKDQEGSLISPKRVEGNSCITIN